MKARVIVTLKSGVLDPAGLAVLGGLTALGFEGVQDVRIGRYFEVDFHGGDTPRVQLEQMCEQLLANTIIEDYQIQLEG
jgi:phosphoribosylformylglycinamidine synthase PurS subunit